MDNKHSVLPGTIWGHVGTEAAKISLHWKDGLETGLWEAEAGVFENIYLLPIRIGIGIFKDRHLEFEAEQLLFLVGTFTFEDRNKVFKDRHMCMRKCTGFTYLSTITVQVLKVRHRCCRTYNWVVGQEMLETGISSDVEERHMKKQDLEERYKC
jgi:hypothetical protein